MSVTVEEMKGKLLTLEDVKTRLGKTEPLVAHEFPMRGKKDEVARWRLEPGWNEGVDALEGTDLVSAYMTIDGSEWQLTKDALLEAGSLIGVTRQYMARTPAKLMEPHLN